MWVRGVVAIGCTLALVAPTIPAQAAAGGASQPVVQAQSAITKARAKTLAKAGVLKKSDLPGFAAERISAEPEDPAAERAFYACLGAKVPKYAARNLGTVFTKDALEIASSADVLTTVAKARADMKLAASKKAPRCIKRLLVVLFEREGAAIESISVKRVDVTVKGARTASAFRYTATATIQGTPLRLVGYSVTALVGQTEISLNPGVFNGPRPSFKQSVALVRTAVKRVAAA